MLLRYIFGGVVASLFGFLLLRRSRDKKRNKPVAAGASAAILKTACGGEDERRFGDEGVDVIVVGAGVAGSALAYTLGKVRIISCRFLVYILLLRRGGLVLAFVGGT